MERYFPATVLLSAFVVTACSDAVRKTSVSATVPYQRDALNFSYTWRRDSLSPDGALVVILHPIGSSLIALRSSGVTSSFSFKGQVYATSPGANFIVFNGGRVSKIDLDPLDYTSMIVTTTESTRSINFTLNLTALKATDQWKDTIVPTLRSNEGDP